MYHIFLSAATVLLLSAASCKKSSTTSSGNNSSNATVPEVYKKIYGATSISTDGNFITIKVDGVPDHK
ncbi:MAG: YHYH protein, partial [Chitinophagia bacterium]|nr:YHYH protein [Chitinophagia bacterium]